jgi:choline dehydrogenase-like flavoprotein
MTESSAFDVIFVGARHHGLIAARHLTENSGSVCLLDQRPIAAKPHTAPSESFMDDPQDFKKRSRTGSPYENPTSPNTYWLCGRLLRDAPGVAESTRAQDRRDGSPANAAYPAGRRSCPS